VCVLLVHHRTREDWPLVLLANRDEAYDRAFEPPAERDAARGIVAPRDLRAGGSWIGRNRFGLVAAITNRKGEDVAEGARSRGLLVTDALRHETVREAVAWLQGHLAQTSYAGFHLLLADETHAVVARHVLAGKGMDARVLRPGAHVLTNLHDLDVLEIPAGGEPDPFEPIEATFARLERLAADDTPSLPGGHRIFKKGKSRGTVSSAVLALAAGDRSRDVFRFAAGPADVTPFVSVP
jgi:hypothetical protein